MTQDPGRPATRCQVFPVHGAGFVTAFGAHAVAANLGRYALGHGGSLWELGLLLGIYDGAEVVLKPIFGALADRAGAKPVMVGGLALFAAASAGFVIGGDPHLLGPIPGGPVLVGAFGLISLTAGLGVLAAALLACAVLIAPRTQASPSHSPAGTA